MRSVLLFLLMLSTGTFAHHDYQQPIYTVAVTPNVQYGTGLVRNAADQIISKALLLDAYVPRGATHSDKPALVVIHGGGFTSGDKGDSRWVNLATYYAARGFVCFSINYRLAGDRPPTPGDTSLERAAYAAFEDAKAAVRWVRANTAQYGLDTLRVAALGGSAGAFMVMTLAVTDPGDYAGQGGHPEQSPRIQAAIDFWGCADHVLDEFDDKDPPVLVVHGTADTTVPFTCAEHIRDRCAQVGIPCAFYPLPGQGHGPWEAVVDGMTLEQLALEFLIRYLNLAPSRRVHWELR